MRVAKAFITYAFCLALHPVFVAAQVTPVKKPGIPFVDPCTALGKHRVLVQGKATVVSDEAPPRPVRDALVKFAYTPKGQAGRQILSKRTDEHGMALFEANVCEGVGRTTIWVQETSGVFKAGGTQPTLVDTGVALHRRPAPMVNLDPNPGGPDTYVSTGTSRPGIADSTNPSLNAGTVDGKSYAHRLLLFTVVTRAPSETISLQPSSNIGCHGQDIDNDGALEVLGDASHMVKWEGEAPDGRADFKRSAVVIFEGIDPNNETYPPHWYTVIKALNRDFQAWNPAAGNWGPDLWISEYGWGGANIQLCLVPDAVQLLRRIALHYRSKYGHVIPITVVGFSMGGVVARAALAQLEKNAGTVEGTSELVDLGIKNFLTLDSPHHGAEIHVVLQTVMEQIHTNPAMRDRRTPGKDRIWLKLHSPAARQLLYERCQRAATVDNQADVGDIGKCATTTTLSHDTFYSWLESQGLAGSNGFPKSLRKFAVSLAIGRSPVANSDTYFHGDSSLFTLHFNDLLRVVAAVATGGAAAPFIPGDLVAYTPYTMGSTDDAWRGRRNRMPGSRIGLMSELPDHLKSISPFGYNIELAGMNGNYNPTFIPLTSALASSFRETRDSLHGFSTYAGSPFDRVWYPVERTACPGSDMPCDTGSWYHDATDIVVNKSARGIDDRVGNGQDAAYGFEYPATSDHRTSTIVEFLSRASDASWHYAPSAALNAPQPVPQTVDVQAWINIPGEDVHAVDVDTLGTPARTAINSTPSYAYFNPVQAGYQADQVVRIRGFLTPKISGEYRIRLAARPSAELKLSSTEYDDSPRVMASVAPPGVGRLSWSLQPAQTSRLVLLNAGSRYYFEIVLKMGATLRDSGGNQLFGFAEIEWSGPDGRGWRALDHDEFGAYFPAQSYGRLLSDPLPLQRFSVSRSGGTDSIRWTGAPGFLQYSYELLWQNSAGQSGKLTVPPRSFDAQNPVDRNHFYAYWLRYGSTPDCNPVLRPCPTVAGSRTSSSDHVVSRPSGGGSMPASFAAW